MVAIVEVMRILDETYAEIQYVEIKEIQSYIEDEIKGTY